MKLFSATPFLLGTYFLPGALSNYCNWNSCNGEVQGGDWCNGSQSNCKAGCGGQWCTNDGGGGPSPSPPGSSRATTTRYWDCSGGACGCAYVPTGLSQDEPVHCHSNAMFAAPAGNPYGAKFYGAAAISSALGGGNWMAEGCGKCWKVTATSNAPGHEGTEETLVLKGTNFCPPENPLCATGPHFDIAAPGFDVESISLSNTCSERIPEEAAGFAACGNWLIGNSNPDTNCDCSLFKNEVLRKGCDNFYSLKWDNPEVAYEEVACPRELSDLHCSYPYAQEETMPETCAKQPGSPPSPSPPSPPTNSDRYCGVESCTQRVWDTIATGGGGGSYSCGSRISWLQSAQGYSERQACNQVESEFPDICLCNPDNDNNSGCCSWNGGQSCGDDMWCNESKVHCEGACSGGWTGE